jgi:hypothetical protein
VAGLEKEAVESTFVNEPLDECDFERMRVTVLMRGTFSERRYLAMAQALSRRGESLVVSRFSKGRVARVWKQKEQANQKPHAIYEIFTHGNSIPCGFRSAAGACF